MRPSKAVHQSFLALPSSPKGLGCSHTRDCRYYLCNYRTLSLGSRGRLDIHNSWLRAPLLARHLYLRSRLDLPHLNRHRDPLPGHGSRHPSSMPSWRFWSCRGLLLFLHTFGQSIGVAISGVAFQNQLQKMLLTYPGSPLLQKSIARMPLL